MAEAKRDQNFVTTLIGVSSSDGVTPINVYVDPTTHRLLADIPSAGGDVVGPSSSTDNAIVRFDGTTGKLLQNSSATLSDAGVLTVTDIVTSEVKASGSGGLDILNSSGSQVALFGAGGSTGTSLFGTTNIGSASADYIQVAGGTGSTTFTATGSSTNIDITAVPKGSGAFKVNGAGEISGSFTLSGGTANGVAYLNGSKVLTTGSALTFDGTNFFGGTNIYTAGRFYAQRSSSSLNLPIAGYTDGSAGAVLSGATGDIVAFGNAGGDGVIFANANTEQMRLNSTGLGIGTSSPTAKLTVDTSGTSGYWERFYNSGTELAYFYFDATTLQLSSKSATRSLIFLTNDTERMRLDSAGNVGIGTSSPSTKLTVSGVTFTDNGVTGGASGLVYALSASNGSNFGQIGNTGTRWSLGYGPSLTALGTEVLTWNSSDNVGIGTSSPAFKLSVQGNAIIGGANPYLAFGSDASVGATPTYIERNGTTGLQTFYNNGTGTNGAMAFVIGAGSEGMRLTSTGLAIGTTGSTNKLLIDTAVSNAGSIQLPRGAFIGFSNAADNANSEYIYANGGNLELGINGSTQLALNSTGLGLGNTSPSYTLDVTGTGRFTKTVSFTEIDNGNSGTADTIDWTQGNKQKSTLTGNCTYTFTAPGSPTSLVFKLVQDATGSRTVTWPAAVHWSGGTAPTLTTTANKVDIITFYYDGTTYFGNSTLNFTA